MTPHKLFPPRLLFPTLALSWIGLIAPFQTSFGQAPPPSKPTATRHVPTNRIVLTLTSSREPSINGQLLRWNRLDAEFRAMYTRRPERVLYIRAHPSNDYQTVARVVELAKRRGLTVHFTPYSDT
jgi:biopolymer transport protein ExbD